VHIDEKAIHLSSPSDEIKIENNHIVVSQFYPLSKWHTLQLDRVKRFRQAVAEYFDQVVFPENGEIGEGSLVTRA
jgi:hypothetical protein